MEKKQINGRSGGDMKRSPSELALEEYLKKSPDDGDDTFGDTADGFYGDVCYTDLGFKNRETMTGFLSRGGIEDTLLWSRQNLIMSKQHSPISAATIDSQSSICVGSPTSATDNSNKPAKDSQIGGGGGATSSSDDDDLEIEAGACEQSNDPIVLKRIRRMVSNRESARRSRRRKQAHMADLELQVDQLRGENAALFKQLTDATYQYRDADTNNRVLKSDVEALRAKVKLAEDMVTRGSLSCSLNQLLQNHLAPLHHQQQVSTHNLCRVGNVSPTVTVRRDHHDASSYAGIAISGQNNANNSSNNNNGIIGDNVSCVSEIWP